MNQRVRQPQRREEVGLALEQVGEVFLEAARRAVGRGEEGD